jgi:sirohydrochlorin ferrochelatase
VERLAYLVRQQLQQCQECQPAAATSQQKISFFQSGSTALLSKTAQPLVGTAALECTPIPLHQQIQEFASQVMTAGKNPLQILPLFLLPGVHVREDIPREVALARQALGSAISLELQPYLGSSGRLPPLLAQQFAQLPPGGRILLSHGSRRLDANEAIAKLACQLGAAWAHWSVPPSLTEQVATFGANGVKSVAIVPYFLFSAGIFAAIASQVQELQAAFPSLQLHLGQPLGATPELARIIVEEVAR